MTEFPQGNSSSSNVGHRVSRQLSVKMAANSSNLEDFAKVNAGKSLETSHSSSKLDEDDVLSNFCGFSLTWVRKELFINSFLLAFFLIFILKQPVLGKSNNMLRNVRHSDGNADIFMKYTSPRKAIDWGVRNYRSTHTNRIKTSSFRTEDEISRGFLGGVNDKDSRMRGVEEGEESFSSPRHLQRVSNNSQLSLNAIFSSSPRRHHYPPQAMQHDAVTNSSLTHSSKPCEMPTKPPQTVAVSSPGGAPPSTHGSPPPPSSDKPFGGNSPPLSATHTQENHQSAYQLASSYFLKEIAQWKKRLDAGELLPQLGVSVNSLIHATRRLYNQRASLSASPNTQSSDSAASSPGSREIEDLMMMSLYTIYTQQLSLVKRKALTILTTPNSEGGGGERDASLGSTASSRSATSSSSSLSGGAASSPSSPSSPSSSSSPSSPSSPSPSISSSLGDVFGGNFLRRKSVMKPELLKDSDTQTQIRSIQTPFEIATNFFVSEIDSMFSNVSIFKQEPFSFDPEDEKKKFGGFLAHFAAIEKARREQEEEEEAIDRGGVSSSSSGEDTISDGVDSLDDQEESTKAEEAYEEANEDEGEVDEDDSVNLQGDGFLHDESPPNQRVSFVKKDTQEPKSEAQSDDHAGGATSVEKDRRQSTPPPPLSQQIKTAKAIGGSSTPGKASPRDSIPGKSPKAPAHTPGKPPKKQLNNLATLEEQKKKLIQLVQAQQLQISKLKNQVSAVSQAAQAAAAASPPLSVGLAYRVPDTNLNLAGSYQNGKTSVQVSCVPDESSHLLGPNGFVHGVGPGNLGISLSFNF